MMRHLWLAFFVLFSARAFALEGVEHVIIVSIDQGSPDTIEKSEMPVLQELVKQGAHTWEAYTVVPSLTLPAHASMISGVGIQKHQIIWNDIDPLQGFIKIPTIFALAKEANKSTAFFASKLKFTTLVPPKSCDLIKVVESVPAPQVAELAARAIVERKPNLCFVHFADADTAGHTYGVYSKEKFAALTECDKGLGILRKAIEEAGIANSSVLIVTSDHGGHDRTPEENAERAAKGLSPQPGTHGTAMTADVVIPWIVWGRGVKKDFTITVPVVTYDTSATALWLLGMPIPEWYWGKPITSAFEPSAR